MSGRGFIVVAALCAAYLAARAATQPASFDFDESAHLETIAHIRQFNGLPPAELYPDILFDSQTLRPAYHHFSPVPYLMVAGATAVAQTAPTSAGILGISRAFSTILAVIAVVTAGLATRNLQVHGATWSAPAAVTAGLTLMPGLHSMGASMTASIWAFAGVGLTTAATAWAARRGWSRGSTLMVAACAAFVIAARASAYPILLLIPTAMLMARLGPRAAALRLGFIAAFALAVNGWWLIRNGLIIGDLLGTGIHVQVHIDGGYFALIRESSLWRRAAVAPWPEWSLLTSSDWLWVGISRMLVRKTWIDPLTLGLWFSMVLAPSASVLVARIWRDRTAARATLPFAAAGIIMCGVSFGLALSLSARLGWFTYLRDVFIVSIPLIAAVAALAAARRDRLRAVFFGAGLAFAAAANAGFLLAVLS